MHGMQFVARSDYKLLANFFVDEEQKKCEIFSKTIMEFSFKLDKR